ncbi:MAG: DUF6456 domain-containing protein [Roseinatronobacter sp.]
MKTRPRDVSPCDTDTLIDAEVLRYLHLLDQPTALLIVAGDMPKAVITCEDAARVPKRLAVLDRTLAEAMALQDWITCRSQGRVTSYEISAGGRLALRNHLAQSDVPRHALTDPDDPSGRRARYGVIDSPVAVLARRRDKAGKPFLEPRLVQAAEWLREDYVTAQLDTVEVPGAQDLVRMLETRTVPGPNVAPHGTKAARQRILQVFLDLGPGLGDVALRCCCRLEGVEAAENALGWCARSGKVVLRIALQRISRQYQRMDEAQMMIG